MRDTTLGSTARRSAQKQQLLLIYLKLQPSPVLHLVMSVEKQSCQFIHKKEKV